MARKRKPGRPKGSKNKPGHKAGRPKGSKNKTASKRGRPKSSGSSVTLSGKDHKGTRIVITGTIRKK